MKEKDEIRIAEWLNNKGYEIDLTDQLWTEEYEWGEHKTRDIIELMDEYHNEQLLLSCVVERSEQLVCSCGSIKVRTTGGYQCPNNRCSSAN